MATTDGRPRPGYQQGPTEATRREIWNTGHISPWMMFRIVAWKSARGVAQLSLNEERVIVAQTACTMDSVRPYCDHNVVTMPTDWDDWERTVREAMGTPTSAGLLSLKGVGYPVATAVLNWLAPDSFPVIDRWAVAGVFGVPNFSRTWRWHNTSAYRAYTEFLARSTHPELIDAGGVHERDTFVMGRMKDNRPIAGLVPIDVPPRH